MFSLFIMKRTRLNANFFLFFAAVITLAQAVLTLQFPRPNLYIALIPLLVVVERFPVQLGALEFDLAFPILYTLGLTNGFSSAGLCGTIVLLVVQLLAKKPPSFAVQNAAIRIITLVLTGLILAPLSHLQASFHSHLAFYLVHLFCAVILFSFLTNGLVLWLYSLETGRIHPMRILLKSSAADVLIGLCYDGFMLILAMNPNNTASGVLGTFFFFVPLTATTLVARLVTNLSRAKSSLEMLFKVSQSINEQTDLGHVVKRIVDEAKALFESDCAAFFALRTDGRLVADDGPRGYTCEISPGVGVVGAAITGVTPFTVEDVRKDTRFVPEETADNMRSLLVVPIHSDSQTHGVISLGKRELAGFGDEDSKLMAIFVTYASVAIKNALYIQEREQRILLEERSRLAREIHDGLAQNIASAVLQVEMIKRANANISLQAMEHLQEQLTHTVSQVRQAIYSLRPQPYLDVGLHSALRAHVSRMERQHGIPIGLNIEGDLDRLPFDTAKILFDIVMEAVQNALKHSKASTISIHIHAADKNISLSVQDNGVGFRFAEAAMQAAAKRSFGIENMYELAERVGATLEIHTRPGHGTLVTFDMTSEQETEHENTRISL